MSKITDMLAAGIPVNQETSNEAQEEYQFTRIMSDEENLLFHRIVTPPSAEQLVIEQNHKTSRAEIKAQYLVALDRLTQIETAVNPTNAQVVAAIKDMAAYEKKIIKILARLI